MQLLSKHQIACTLSDHGIQHKTDLAGNLLALDVYTQFGIEKSEWINVTNYSRIDLLNWLGYDLLPEMFN